MSEEKRYVVFGAGAIGCALGGMLARAGERVISVARPAQAEALKRGILIKQDQGNITITTEAVTAARDLRPETGDIIVITTKSQSTARAVEELASIYDKSTPVVCLQNGVSNEPAAASRFENVYAGLVFFSAVQMEPAIISMPRGRVVAIGLYPQGVDDLSRRMADSIRRAGFDAMASAYVMAMKWGKLIANLNNATLTITGYWVEYAMAEPEHRKFMLAVRDEGLRVLEAAGIAAEPPEDEPSPIRIRALTEKLRRLDSSPENAASMPEHQRTYASMWQDLALGRRSHEAEYLNGEIVRLGRELGIPTPYNSTLLEIIDRMFAEGLSSGLYKPGELQAIVSSRSSNDR
jgi:2-dehydropantoate 2-reductase